MIEARRHERKAPIAPEVEYRIERSRTWGIREETRSTDLESVVAEFLHKHSHNSKGRVSAPQPPQSCCESTHWSTSARKLEGVVEEGD